MTKKDELLQPILQFVVFIIMLIGTVCGVGGLIKFSINLASQQETHDSNKRHMLNIIESCDKDLNTREELMIAYENFKQSDNKITNEEYYSFLTMKDDLSLQNREKKVLERDKVVEDDKQNEIAIEY